MDLCDFYVIMCNVLSLICFLSHIQVLKKYFLVYYAYYPIYEKNVILGTQYLFLQRKPTFFRYITGLTANCTTDGHICINVNDVYQLLGSIIVGRGNVCPTLLSSIGRYSEMLYMHISLTYSCDNCNSNLDST